MTFDPYIRRATLVRVIDADTYEMMVDLGYRVFGRYMIRVIGFDAPELNTPEGVAMAEKAREIFATAKTVYVKSYLDRQSFARWLAEVYVDEVNIVSLLTSTTEPAVKTITLDFYPSIMIAETDGNAGQLIPVRMVDDTTNQFKVFHMRLGENVAQGDFLKSGPFGKVWRKK